LGQAEEGALFGFDEANLTPMEFGDRERAITELHRRQIRLVEPE